MLWLKSLVFTLVVPATVAVYLPLWLVRGRAFVPGPLAMSGAVLLLGGALVYAWCAWDFIVSGRGTPLPLDAPRQLVVRGLYRYTRNPMYVGVLTTILGWAAWFQSGTLVVYGAIVFLLFHTFVVLHEEPALGRQFGKQYDDYRSSVQRWLPARRRRPTAGP